jgi:hypothetical protein
MSNFCSSENKSSLTGKHICPDCERLSRRVSATTISHHLIAPWQWLEEEKNHYFCEAPDCDVVYFSEDGWTAACKDVRTTIGLKNPSDGEALICYCFGVGNDEAAANPEVKTYVINKTKAQACACETRNPAGRCCLKDFPK